MAPPRTSLGSYDAPRGSQVRPPTADACDVCILQFTPLAVFPDCGAQIMVTLT